MVGYPAVVARRPRHVEFQLGDVPFTRPHKPTRGRVGLDVTGISRDLTISVGVRLDLPQRDFGPIMMPVFVRALVGAR